MLTVHLSVSECLLYGGITAMAVAIIASFVCMAVFRSTGKKIRDLMEQEYGKPGK